jgi:uncharacterized protein (UPF0333 family)
MKDIYCYTCKLIVERITKKQVINLTHNGITFTIKAYKTVCENGHTNTTEEEKRVIARKGKRKYYITKIINKSKSREDKRE